MCVHVCLALPSCSMANLCLTTGRPAGLSRKARQGSAEMSGCHRDSPTDMSTEQYHVVKERRGGRRRGLSVQEWAEDEMGSRWGRRRMTGFGAR